MNTATTTTVRFVIVNARGALATDLGDQGRGADLGWESYEAAEAALESLAETCGWDVSSYSVRELRTTDLAGERREELLQAVRACGAACARSAVAACGSYDPDGPGYAADWAYLKDMLAARFGAEIPTRGDADLQRAWQRGQEEGAQADEETAECAYCGRSHAVRAEAPALDDDATWGALAKEHDSDCAWILTRAHRVEVVRVFKGDAESSADGWANDAFYALQRDGRWVREGIDNATGWEECEGRAGGEEYVTLRVDHLAAARETLASAGYRVEAHG